MVFSLFPLGTGQWAERSAAPGSRYIVRVLHYSLLDAIVSNQLYTSNKHFTRVKLLPVDRVAKERIALI